MIPSTQAQPAGAGWLLVGDCLDIIPTLAADSIDAIVTDPPYGLAFMGKAWDRGVPGESFWREALRVAKPGAPLVAFGGTRTYHRLTCAIEDAGWEVRDTLMWLYGSGFPKAKSCLKPAWEPILLAKKPGACPPLNVESCRIGTSKDVPASVSKKAPANAYGKFAAYGETAGVGGHDPNLGRWPANLLLDEASAAALGEPSRFFYCAKASKKDRGEGNIHPTVKPTDLMCWIVRLVTPPGGVVLDPFMGSGSTGKAALAEGLRFIGIERDPAYVEIARRRISEAA